jgi:hypothetical protein
VVGYEVPLHQPPFERVALLRREGYQGEPRLAVVVPGVPGRHGRKATLSLIAADYAFGHETAGGFQKTFEDCGGKIVQKIWPPIGTKDFGPYIPTIKADIDAIFALMVGPMSLQFPKQLRASGFKIPILGGGTNYDEFILPSMGDEVIGDVSAFMYSAALDTPRNRAFVTKYRSAYGKVASYYSEANYTTAQWIDETMKRHGGKYPGPLEFIKTMQSIKLDAIRGPVSLDDRLTAINDIYIKLHPPCSGPVKPEHRPAATSRRSLQACIASLPLQSSLMQRHTSSRTTSMGADHPSQTHADISGAGLAESGSTLDLLRESSSLASR